MKRIILIIMLFLGVLSYSEEESSQKSKIEVTSQNEKISGENSDKNIGLVLSGGSAKGLAHVGVLKILDQEKVPIEYVTGTSMGSIIGALYTSGYTVDEIEQIVFEMDWISLFNDQIPRDEKGAIRNYFEDKNSLVLPMEGLTPKLPNGAIGGKSASERLSELFYGVEGMEDFKKFPQKFALVVTDLETGEGIMIDKGSLSASIRSSMSIPAVFSPVRYDGRLLVDGGVVRNLPVQDAKVLGADYTIGVNVGDGFSKIQDKDLNLFSVTGNVATIAGRAEVERQKRMLDLYIAPDLSNVASTDFYKAKQLIELGEAAALANIDEIRKLSDPVKYAEIQKKREEFRKTWKESYSITKIEIVGNKKFDESYFKRFIPKDLTNLKAADIKKITNQIYQNGSFSNVFYEIKGETLVIHAEEKPSNYLVVTGNINNEDLAAVSIGFQGDKLIGNSDIRYAINGVVNEEYGVNGKAAVAVGENSKGLITADFLVKKDIIRNQDSGNGKYEFSNRIMDISLGLGAEIRKNLVVGIGGGYQVSKISDNPDTVKNIEMKFPYYSALGYYDTRDSAVFPTRGMFVRLDYVGTSTGNAEFNTINVRAEYNQEIAKKITITPNIRYVTTDGNKIPETYYPKLGGYRSSDYSFEFRGVPSSKYRGKSLLIGGLKFQYNITDFIFADLVFSNASISEDSFSIGSRMKQSYSTGVGIKTPIGPAFIGVSKTAGEDTTYFFNLGYDVYAE